MVFVEEPVLDPSGDRVFYVERRAGADHKGYHTRILEWSADGGHRPLTTPLGNSWAPRLSPDGRHLAFLSNRTGAAQLWVLPLGGGEARPLTDLPFAPASPAWSPDSRRLAFVAAESLVDPLQPGYAEDVIVVRRRHYRTNGERVHEERHRALFVYDLDGGVEKVSTDPYDYAAPTWSPDGRSLAVIARRGPDADGAWVRDVWRLDLRDRQWTQLTDHLAASSPSWAPDGTTIAFYGHDGRFGRATCAKLWEVAADGSSEAILVRPEWDVEPGSHVLTDARGTASIPGPVWAAGSREIWVVADAGGASRLYAVPRDDGPVRTLLTGDRTIYGLSLNPATGAFALAAQTAQSPGEISVGRIGGQEGTITDTNPWLRDVWLAAPTSFLTESPGGLTVEAWVLKPQRDGAGPTVLEIHGGPHAAYGHSFFFEFQMLAGMGIGVVYSNPRGSTGYGQDHCTPVQDHWGVGASDDVLAVLDHAIALYPWIDQARLGITGGSFGGYLTNWILTRTDRFSAALAQRSVSNRYSFVGTSDMGFRGMEEYGGPWAEPEHYRDSSPLAYADHITTPLLLLHSEEDWRCPIEQAEQLFVALKMLGREVEMVRYPGESHELSRSGRPDHRVDRLWRIARWFGNRL
jgi:dipeptidyl aminopeptidase/acylaminoacyl peptidase